MGSMKLNESLNIFDDSVLALADALFIIRDFYTDIMLIVKGGGLDGYLIFNNDAYKIWKIIENHKKITFKKLKDSVKALFSISDDEIDDLVISYIKNLADLHLIEIEGYKPKVDIENPCFKLGRKLERYELSYKHNKILSASIDISSRCNLNCIHCYCESLNQKEDLSFGDIKKIASSLKKIGVYSVTLTGGEPLMRKDIFDIAKYFNDNGFLINLNTNAYFIDRAIINKLKDLRNLVRIQVSLYGSTKGTHDNITKKKGSFEKTLKGLKLLSELNKQKPELEVKIAFGFFKNNYKEFGAVCNLSKELGIGLGILGSIHPKLNGDFSIFKEIPNLKTIRKSYSDAIGKVDYNSRPPRIKLDGEEIVCRAGLDIIHIDSLGGVFPCLQIQGENISAGNILKEDIIGIIKRMRKTWPIKISDTVCGQCKEKETCAHLCPAVSYYKNNGDLKGCSKIEEDDYPPTNSCTDID